jgi:hypothetical protein
VKITTSEEEEMSRFVVGQRVVLYDPEGAFRTRARVGTVTRVEGRGRYIHVKRDGIKTATGWDESWWRSVDSLDGQAMLGKTSRRRGDWPRVPRKRR